MTASSSHIGYCLKCKMQRKIANAQHVILKNGTPAIQGTCSVCGTKLTRIVPRKAWQQS